MQLEWAGLERRKRIKGRRGIKRSKGKEKKWKMKKEKKKRKK